jgi:hypothetical protein
MAAASGSPPMSDGDEFCKQVIDALPKASRSIKQSGERLPEETPVAA